MGFEAIFGPPGTGKTTELSRLIHQYVEEDGSDSVLVCAYTRAAAQELAGRELPIDAQYVGTLHSHCYQALDCPKIAESSYKDWNDAYPVYALSPQKSLFQSDEPRQHFRLLGDEYLHAVNVLRHCLVPRERWPVHVVSFWERWSAWKHEHGYYDFTDLIDKARMLLPVPPGRPETLIVDEAQDLSLLQWDLLTQWARHTTRFIGAGDDDQALYRWAGADFHPLLAAEHRRILPQSYRVPRAIQAWVNRYTQSLTERQPKTWQPQAENGIMSHEAGTWAGAEALLGCLDDWYDPWETLAFIAPCAYMLDPLIEALEREGIPFSNRWRRNNPSWNPLAPPSRGVGVLQRLRDFLRPLDRLWTWQELATWIPLIRADGVLRHGAKSIVTAHADETKPCEMAEIESLFLPATVAGALHGTVTWLEDHVLQTQGKRLHYPLQIYKKYGQAGLTDEPHITVGTVHSLKGAETDTVVFFQDLSRSQRLALCEGGEEADDIYRMLYVGCTRAKRSLYLVGELGI